MIDLKYKHKITLHSDFLSTVEFKERHLSLTQEQIIGLGKFKSQSKWAELASARAHES